MISVSSFRNVVLVILLQCLVPYTLESRPQMRSQHDHQQWTFHICSSPQCRLCEVSISYVSESFFLCLDYEINNYLQMDLICCVTVSGRSFTVGRPLQSCNDLTCPAGSECRLTPHPPLCFSDCCPRPECQPPSQTSLLEGYPSVNVQVLK